MAKFKSKAEQQFQTKLDYFISRREWEEVERLFHQFGCYLQLIEPLCEYKVEHTSEVGDLDICKVHGNNSRYTEASGPHRPCLTIDPWPKEVEHVPANEPTVIEEQMYILSGDFRRDEIERAKSRKESRMIWAGRMRL